jgi:glycosyltransferase involved in cell wall biosynthesis
VKILIIQSWIKQGGAELISVEMARELKAQSQEVAVAATFVDLSGMPEQAASLDYLVPPEWLQKAFRRSRVAFLLVGPFVLLSLVWRHSRAVDILNPHNFPSSWIAVLVGSLRRIPVIWTCNEPPELPGWRDALRIGVADYVGWLVAASWFDRLLVKRIQEIYVPSERTRKQVQARYGRDATIIRIGLSHERHRRVHGIPHPDDGRQSTQSFVMLAVGKLHPQKNQIVCIEALRLIQPCIPNAMLILAGDGPMCARWRQYATSIGVDKSVSFLGQVPGTEVRGLYEKCDVNLFPAINQSWGLTPFEALCAGKISIVSADTGAAEVLQHAGVGIVCEPTPQSFADSIKFVHANPDLMRSMAAKGRELVLRDLTWQVYCKAFVDLAVGLIGSPMRQERGGLGIGEVSG